MTPRELHEVKLAEKKALRQKMLAFRKGLTKEQHEAKSRAILARLYEEPRFQQARTIFAYASMPDEVQLYDLLAHALREGKRVSLPLITGKGLMEAVNLGTRGLAEALDLLEYANVPNGTARSKERIRNGAKDPLQHPHVVLGQRDGRPVANGTQKRRGLRQARSLGRGRHAHDRPGPRAGGLRFVEPHDGHVRQVGRDRARTHLRQSELRIRAPSPSTARSASTAPSRIPKPTASSSSTRSSHSARSFRSPRTSSSAMNRRRAA